MRTLEESFKASHNATMQHLERQCAVCLYSAAALYARAASQARNAPRP